MSLISLPCAPFTGADVEVENRESMYRGFLRIEKLTLRHRLFAGGWSRSFTREVVIRGAAVGVLLYDPENDLVGLVEQFRVGALAENSPWCLEVVAGMVETGETPEAVALRELVEEAGVENVALEFICQYFPSPGGTDERMHLFCAQCNLQNREGVFGLDDENEDIRFHVLPADQVMAALTGGQFNNAAVLICLLWLSLNRQRLQQAVGAA
ncbi:NUDIX domain-containing protein [Cellvibrio polysaccharolyticus]|uniref:ADP-ribose pyrophosphatase n=1 Tax=Cellvibrio polysaccharolyticus TaxID=2082724 RepID=A0A928YV65_9GAMM|nr:NUDIX domain-containing protein [Cellvibrio polysaccharolyticus]MBE8718707.1 NUDIX domain-containing protein [Cellvibrio polysaccharolyticus]